MPVCVSLTKSCYFLDTNSFCFALLRAKDAEKTTKTFLPLQYNRNLLFSLRSNCS